MVRSVNSQKIPQGFLVFTRPGTVQNVLIVEDVWRKMLGVTFNAGDILLGGSYQFSFELFMH